MVERVPEGRKPVGSKSCFDYNADKEENIIKIKARLVATEFTQIRNVDYPQSSFPCSSSASIKLVLADANKRGLPLYHFDVAQACIRTSLDEDIYMKRSGGNGKKSKHSAK